MKNIKILFLFFTIICRNVYSVPIEIDVTKGVIEPLPIAIKFNYKSIQEKLLSNQLYQVISNDLTNSGLFKKISNEAFLQAEESFQPLFRDWGLIDANLIISGNINIENNSLL